MPSFQGQISEEGILQLIVYIKSLAITNAPGAPTRHEQLLQRTRVTAGNGREPQDGGKQ